MKMKKLSIAAIVMLGLGVNAAQATDGTINFHGTVTSPGCNVVTGAENLTVNFTAMPVAALSPLASGTTTSELQKPFSIKLENCPTAIQSAVMKLSGLVSGYNNKIFTGPSGTGTAGTVGYVVSEAATPSTYLVSNTSTVYGKPLTAGNNSLDYLVGMSRTTGNKPVTTGTMNAVINYELSYQ
ncbi:fimbrial protein [Buttiauxella izardii]|uniref:Type 1 fimbrial protein n=1 Tax=Buttiauxella izardii TaxID=82991 RepID=A0A3A5K0W3_9ENTR|nr:fimbrial protein [Buttiauxella izardii]RJT21017.1 type 1 fimbrial protein [Buttiauxella izardii]